MILLSSFMPLHGGLAVNLRLKWKILAKKFSTKFKDSLLNGNSPWMSRRHSGNGSIVASLFRIFLSHFKTIPLNEYIFSNILASTLMNVSPSINIVEKCFRLSKRTPRSWNTLVALIRHVKKARELLSYAFNYPYFQLLYAIWPLLSQRSIEHIEAKYRQLSRLIHTWFDATVDEVHCFPNYQTIEMKAQRFLRRFLDKAFVLTPNLFNDYIIAKAMPLYLEMHHQDHVFIQHLLRGRTNRYVRHWMNHSVATHRCFLDKIVSLLARMN